VKLPRNVSLCFVCTLVATALALAVLSTQRAGAFGG
jgi:hypothetical protein